MEPFELKNDDLLSQFLNDNEDFVSEDEDLQVAPVSTPSKRTLKLAKNRESAKNTRLRKKQHENDLEKQLADLICKMNTLKHDTGTENSISNFYRLEKQELFSKLRGLLETNSENEQISDVLTTLRKKLGVMGVERQGYIEYLTHQVCEISLPPPLKLLFQNRHKNGWQSFLNCPEPEENDEVEAMQKKYASAIKNLKKARNCLLRRTRNLQNIIDYLAALLEPRQVAHLILRLNSSGTNINPW